MSDNNVINTVSAKTELQINDRVQTAATSTSASDEMISETIVILQDCVVSF